MPGIAPLLLIHGLGDGPESWDAVASHLPRGFAGRAIAVPGLRPGSDEEFSFSAADEAIAQEVSAAAPGGSAVLCGHSLGAMAALHLAAERPESVAGLVLMSGQVRPPRVLMAVQSAIMRALPERMVSVGDVGKSRVLAAARTAARMDLRPALPGIRVPTLVLCGARDRANLPASRLMAARIPGAELRIVEGAGHRVHVEAAEAVAAAITRFLAGSVR